MKKIVITGTEVNVRTGPGLSFDILKKATYGEQFDFRMSANDIDNLRFAWHASPQGWTRADLSKIVEAVDINPHMQAMGPSFGTEIPQKINGKFPPPCEGWIYDGYHPQTGHRGIDITTTKKGVPIWGIPGAKVHRVFQCVLCGTDPEGQAQVGNFSKSYGYGFGNYLVYFVDGLYIMYAHLSRINSAVEGRTFLEGSIGYMGKSGNASGYHLHLEVRSNDIFDTTTRDLIDPREVFQI